MKLSVGMELDVEEVVELLGSNVGMDVIGFVDCPHYDNGGCNNCDGVVGSVCNLGVQRKVVDSYGGCNRYLVNEYCKSDSVVVGSFA